MKMFRKLTILLLVLGMNVSALANTKGVFYISRNKGIHIGIPGLQLTSEETAPTDAKLAAGRIYYDTTSGLLVYNGSSWLTLATGVSGSADAVYNANAWTVDVDANDVIFRMSSTSYNILLDTNVTGTSAQLLVLDAKHNTATVTDALLFTTTGTSAVMTDAIDASDAGIVNALVTGANDLSGTNWAITGSTGAGTFVGVATGTGDLTVATTKMVIAGATGKMTGGATADIDLNSVFTVDATQGNTVIGGTCDITGVTTITGALAAGSFSADAVAAKTGGGTLLLDGDVAGGVTLQSIGTGDITLTTDVVMSAGATVAADLTVSGGDITVPSATASKPVLWLENTANDATCPVIKLENDRTTETDGDDLGIISFYGSDSGDAALAFVTILAEANEINAGDEAGKLSINLEMNDADTAFLGMFGDTTNSSTGHFEINSGAVDVDFHYDGNDAADLVLFNAGDNGVTLTRALAAGATTAAEVLSVDQTSATADNGCASFTNAAAASASEPTVTIQSSATAMDQPSLFINHDATAGATTYPAVLVDSEAVDIAAVVVKAATDGTGSTAADSAVLAVIAEGIGGGIDIGRDVANTTHPALNILCDNVDDAYEAIRIIHDGDATIATAIVGIESTALAMDEPHIELIQDDDTTGSAAVLQFTKDNDGGEADGNDLGSIRFVGDDSGDAEHEFGYILFEAADITAATESGKMSVQLEIADTDTAFLGMFGDAGAGTTGHFEINSGAADIDFHLDGNDQADLITTNADTDTITLNVSQADSQLLILQADTTGTTNEELIFINDDRTGANASSNDEATMVIDAEGSHGLYVMDGIAEFADTCIFAGGQTRKTLIDVTCVALDGTNPPTLGTIGSDAQNVNTVLQFDANPGGNDDVCYVEWVVPEGYVTDSAALNVYWSFSTAETNTDECVIDGTVNAVAPGEAVDAAGTACAAVTSVIADASADNGKLIKTILDIEVETIAVGDLVTILFFFDESACLMDASGTADVYYFEIEYESTE